MNNRKIWLSAVTAVLLGAGVANAKGCEGDIA